MGSEMCIRDSPNPKHSHCELFLDKSLNKEHISHGYVIPRNIFDNYMFEQARKVSDVEEGFSVSDLLIEGDKVIGVKGKSKEGSEKEFKGSIVFGADGPNSIVSKRMGLYSMDMEHTAVGIRCYYENVGDLTDQIELHYCLLYTSPSPRDLSTSRMPSSA